jgi:sRNA-binding protein
VTRRAKLLLAALALATAALVMAQRPRVPEAAAAASLGSGRSPRPAAAAAATPVDPATIRDVFRFAERPLPAPLRSERRPSATPLPSPSPDLPKLVGLVRRQGRLLAAFSQGGEVLLAGPGDTAAGVTVVDVSEDGVRVRLKDGSEELLRVP